MTGPMSPPGASRNPRPAFELAKVGAVRVGAFAAGLLALYPFVLSALREGSSAAFRYFAGDAYYYLAIGRHSAGRDLFTFDQTHATSGFHPLWQIVVTSLFPSTPAREAIGQAIAGVYWISAVLLAAAALLLYAVVLRLSRSPGVALFAVVPGFFALAFTGARFPRWDHWSWANGLETPLSLMLFAAAVWWMVASRVVSDGRPSRDLVLGLALAAITLARLDDVFLYLAVLVAIALAGAGSLPWRRLAIVAAPGFAAIGGYLIYNWMQTGAPMPISGAAKAGLELRFNLTAAFGALVPFELFRPGAPVTEWASKGWRVVQLLVPALVAGVWLVRRSRRRSNAAAGDDPVLASTLSILSVYVLLKAAYCLAWVKLWHQGWWYFPLSIATANLILARGLGPALRRIEAVTANWRPGPLLRAAATAGASTAFAAAVALVVTGSDPAAGSGRLSAARIAAVVVLALVGIAAVRARRDCQRFAIGTWLVLGLAATWALLLGSIGASGRIVEARGQAEMNFLPRCAAVEAELGRLAPSGGVVAFDDGLLATCFDRPVLNGIGLALDLEAHRARQRGELLDLAWRRGYRALAGSYYLAVPESSETSSDAIREALSRFRFAVGSEDLERWKFELISRDRASGTIFVAFAPRELEGAAGRGSATAEP